MEPSRHAPFPATNQLRIALLLSSFRQPRWVCRAIESIRRSGHGSIVLVVRPREKNGQMNGGRRRRLRHLGCLAHAALDDWYFGSDTDSVAPASLEPLLEGVEILEVERGQSPEGETLDDRSAQALRERRLDVALAFGFHPRGESARGLARYGLWSYRMEPADPDCGGLPSLWEVLRARPVTESVLEADCDGTVRPLCRSVSATDPFSVRRNRDHVAALSAAFVERALRDARVGGASRPADEPGDSGPRESTASAPCPGNLEMLRLGLGLAARFARDRLGRLRYDEKWALAVSRRTDSASATRPTILRPPRGVSWADPFPLRQAGDVFIFLEEIPRGTRKGHISVLALDPRGSWQPPVKILEREHHLAYPFVFEWSGELFMIPETRASGTVELFRCTRFPDTWRAEKVLLHDVSASDATLQDIDGRWWMFVNVAAEGALNTWDELHLYHADSPLGPWTAHRRNPVKSDVRSSRPAGRLYRQADGLYRPAQDCSLRYGHSIVMNRVTRIDPDQYSEIEVSRILPGWEESVLATHTYNRLDDLTVLDCLLRRPRFL
jgi:hypothetical protein